MEMDKIGIICIVVYWSDLLGIGNYILIIKVLY